MKKYFFIGLAILCFFNAKAQYLENLVDEALKNNPEIQKFQLQYEIATEQVNEVNSLPNTQFEFGVTALKPKMDMPMERFRVSAMQMLPWFGTITAKENYMNSLASVAYQEILVAKRKLTVSVSQSYYNIIENEAKQKVLLENIELLKVYEKLALTNVATGTASAVDVLRLQIRQNELEKTRKVLLEQYKSEQTILNKLLNREIPMLITGISDLTIPIEDGSFNRSNLSQNPELTRFDERYNAVNKSDIVNKKENQPILGFGLEYSNLEKTSMVEGNFKDMLMPMVSISIPIFNNKYKSQTKQNLLQRQEILTEKQEQLNELESVFSRALSERTAARINYEMQDKSLKQAKEAEVILRKSYETGIMNFRDILDIQELQLNFQTGQIESIKIYYIQSAIINSLIN